MFNRDSDTTSKLTRQEQKECFQKKKELELVQKRLNCHADLKIKIILVGNSNVGKTSLIQKFVDQRADIRKIQITVMCDFFHCELRLSGKNVHIRMWDTAGIERYHASNLMSQFYRNSQGVLLVFAVDDYDSFLALPEWMNRVRENIGQGSRFDCCVVGNKSDRAEKRVVSRLEAESFAYQQGFPYIETSALDSVNVHKAFTDVALAIIKRQEMMQQSASGPARDRPIRLNRLISKDGDEEKDRKCCSS